MSDQPPVPPGATPGSTPPPAYPQQPPLAPPLPPVPPGAYPGDPRWPAPPPPPPTGSDRPGWIVPVAIIAVVALLIGLFIVLRDDDSGGGDFAAVDTSTTTTEPDTTTTTAAEVPAELDPTEFQALVDDIEAFVEQERGLQFTEEVLVELAGEGDFQDQLLADFEENVPDLVDSQDVLRALGLIDPDTDLVAALRDLLDAGVVGFYNPETNRLVVRGTSATPYVQTTIAHELTHALDDQHFELFRPELDDADDESGFGFTALSEGDAVHVEDAFLDTFTDEERQQYDDEEAAIAAGYDFATIPLVLFALIGAPYLFGPELVATILDAGGQERLDAAFAQPPTTSEQVLEPERYVAGEGPIAVPAPPADGEQFDQGAFGALVLGILINDAAVFGGGQPGDAVDGWGGDAYVAWRNPDGTTCVRASFVGDTQRDTDEIAAALRDFADSTGANPLDASVTGGEPGQPVTLTSCG